MDKKKDKDFKYIVRLKGTDLNGKKEISQALTKIRGIGKRIGRIICDISGVDSAKKAGNLTDDELSRIDKNVSDFQSQKVPSWLFNRRKDYSEGKDLYIMGSSLVMSLREDLNRLKKIRSYRGIRHELGLPVRGQRTRTSFRIGVSVGVSREKMAEAAARARAEEEKKKR